MSVLRLDSCSKEAMSLIESSKGGGISSGGAEGEGEFRLSPGGRETNDVTIKY